MFELAHCPCFKVSSKCLYIVLDLPDSRYMVTQLMGADLNSILKCQQLSDDHVKFLIYQILRGLKVCTILSACITVCHLWYPCLESLS